MAQFRNRQVPSDRRSCRSRHIANKKAVFTVWVSVPVLPVPSDPYPHSYVTVHWYRHPNCNSKFLTLTPTLTLTLLTLLSVSISTADPEIWITGAWRGEGLCPSTVGIWGYAPGKIFKNWLWLSFCVVSLITEGVSSVVKRYFEGLENGGPLFASHVSRNKRLSTRRDNSQSVCCACHYC